MCCRPFKLINYLIIYFVVNIINVCVVTVYAKKTETAGNIVTESNNETVPTDADHNINPMNDENNSRKNLQSGRSLVILAYYMYIYIYTYIYIYIYIHTYIIYKLFKINLSPSSSICSLFSKKIG